MTDRQSTVASLIDYLRYQRECGVHALELEPATLTALAGLNTDARKPAPATASRKQADAPAAAEAPKASRRPKASPTPLVVTPEAAAAALAQVTAAITACRKCVLCQERTNVVPGQGNPVSPDILFIGEAPGADEDRQGLAFVGRAGQLLTKMITAMGYTREEVFIANICKCRPPNNRPPTPDEMEACLPYLKEQIRIIRPRTIVAMGNTAILGLLGSTGITRLRGNWVTFEGIPLMPTLHPSYLLRFPTVKRDAWNDLKKVLKQLGRPVPSPAAPGEG
jgi:DNA polymerase